MTYTHKPLPLSTVDKLDKPKTRGCAVDLQEIHAAEIFSSLSTLSICRQGVACLAVLVRLLTTPPGQGTPGDMASTGNSNPEFKLLHGLPKGVVL